MKKIIGVVIFYLLSIVAAILLFCLKIIPDFIEYGNQSASRNLGVTITCLALILIAEWICLFAFHFPFVFFGKVRKKKEFFEFVDKNVKYGRSYNECLQEFEEKNKKEKEQWIVDGRYANGFFSIFFKMKIGEITPKICFFRNRCNNLRTIVLFTINLFLWLDGEWLEWACYLPIIYCCLMYFFVYRREENLFNAMEVGKEFRACERCKMITRFDHRQTYEAANFNDEFTKYHTTYKNDYKGSLEVGDVSISLYGKKADETTVTAYGYQTDYYRCPYCAHEMHVGKSVEEKQTYKW